MADLSESGLKSILNPDSGAASAAPGSAATGNTSVSRHDPSLLHQISLLQAEKQDLLTARRELEGKLKESQDAKDQTVKQMEQQQSEHAKEKEEFIDVYHKEMKEVKDNFMNDWMETLGKLSPEVIAKMKTGVETMVDKGDKSNRMWEILCTASKAHKMNVDAIEELRVTNTMLSDKNKDLEEKLRDSTGFADPGARLTAGISGSALASGTKRPRVDNPEEPAVGSSRIAASLAAPGATDVWGQFEQYMIQSNGTGIGAA